MTEEEFRSRDDREPKLTFGEKAVGLTFNPSGSPNVDACKRGFASEIDRMHQLREQILATKGECEQARLCSVAITEMQTAQMWAVKAITWRD